MGSDKIGGNENPLLHDVTISKSFYLGKNLVTQEQWYQIVGRNPSCFKGAKNPVEQVSWNDCQNFTIKLKEKVPGYSFRLQQKRSGNTPTLKCWAKQIKICNPITIIKRQSNKTAF